MSFGWPGNALGSSRKCPGRGKSGWPCSDICPRDLVSDKQNKMDGWMDGWMDGHLQIKLGLCLADVATQVAASQFASMLKCFYDLNLDQLPCIQCIVSRAV